MYNINDLCKTSPTVPYISTEEQKFESIQLANLHIMSSQMVWITNLFFK